MKKRIKELLFNKKHFDLQYFISIVLIAVMLVVSVAALLVNTVSLSRQLERNMETYANDLTAQLAREISSKMTMRNSYISNFADTLSALDKEELTEALLEQNAKRLNMDEIFIVDKEGKTFFANPKHAHLGKYLTENPQLYKGPHVFFTEANEVFYSSPLHWPDGESVLLIGARDKVALQEMLADVAERFAGFCCMVDSSGKAIVAAEEVESFQALSDVFSKLDESKDKDEALHMISDIKNRQSGVAMFETIAEEPLMLGYDFLGINDWMLLTLVPANQFSVGVNAHLMRYIGILVAMTLLMGVLFFYMIGVYRRSLNRIQDIALTDVLTGGNNDQAFRIECERLLKDYPNQAYAVVYLNIRNFKRLNERFGVRISDQILIKFYAIMAANLYDNETVAHSVGDHYYLLLRAASEDAVRMRLEEMSVQMVDELSSDYLIERSRLAFGVYMVQKRDMDVLWMQSWAKRASDYVRENQICSFYNETIEAALAWEHQLEDDFERAIKNREFKLYVQPKVSLHQTNVHSGEVLVRWQHPTHGMISPGRFIPIFERDGKICDLDFYMFEETCKLLRIWLDEGCALPLSVNLSRAHLVDSDMTFLKRFETLKARYRIPDGMIELELTESLMLENREMALVVKLIDHIRQMGFLCSIDDFGSGYSSLSILKELNVSTVKLDRQFFLDESEKSWKVVQQMMNLAHDLNMTVVAEGIEDRHQVEVLRQLGCDFVQGYVFAKPMPVDEFKSWSLE